MFKAYTRASRSLRHQVLGKDYVGEFDGLLWHACVAAFFPHIKAHAACMHRGGTAEEDPVAATHTSPWAGSREREATAVSLQRHFCSLLCLYFCFISWFTYPTAMAHL